MVLIVCGFHVTKFCYLLKSTIYSPKSTHAALSGSFRHAQSSEAFKLPLTVSPAESEQSNSLPSVFSSQTTNKCSSCDLLSLTFFTFLYFCLVILLFKMHLLSPSPSQVSCRSVSNVPKTKKVTLCFMEKISVLGQPCSGVSLRLKNQQCSRSREEKRKLTYL